MNKMIKIRILFILLSLILSGLILYFGNKVAMNQVVVTQQNNQLLAEANAQKFAQQIFAQLNEYRLIVDPIKDQYITSNEIASLSRLPSNVTHFFIFTTKGDHSELIYPTSEEMITQDDQLWLENITPVINEPSLLYAHNITSEMEPPTEGWYISKATNQTLFIYWIKKGNEWFGFNFSYSYFLAEIIHQLSDKLPSNFALIENHRVLIGSSVKKTENTQNKMGTIHNIYSYFLSYPLIGWNFEYRVATQYLDIQFQWLINTALMILLLNVALVYLYRSYSRSIREAMQQVSFVGQVSHELKTPLTNILLYTELLQEALDVLDVEGELNQRLNVIGNEGRRLSRLIQNLLSFTRKPTLRINTFAVSELIHEIKQLFDPIFAVKKMDFMVRIPEDFELESDRDLICQILGNFLSNAEKYASEGKRVDIMVTRSKDNAQLSVRDYGKGILKGDLKRIFKPFTRLNNSVTEGVSGTGIGLTIASQLAEILQGTIIVDHESKGVCFTLVIPITWKK